MPLPRPHTLAAPLLLLGLAGPALLGAQTPKVDVLTQRYDTNRSGHNPRETVLTPAAVRRSFGKLYEMEVDGQVYAQPLVVNNVPIDGRVRDLLIVATARNTIYYFDAGTGARIWSRNFGTAVQTQTVNWPLPWGPYRDMSPESGITSTPVVDLPNGTLYFTTFTQGPDSAGGQPVRRHRLHALGIATRTERNGSPMVIRYPFAAPDPVALQASRAREHHQGHGVPSGLHFDSDLQLQRTALLLTGGRVVFGLGSIGDASGFQGWVFSYDAADLTRAPQVWAATSEAGGGGGVWQSGTGLATDGQGNVYFTTGNGDFDGRTDFGDSAVKLRLSDLQRVDSFTPCNQQELKDKDLDLTSGLMRLPGTGYVIGGGKQGTLYLLHESDMGGYTPPLPGGACPPGRDRIRQTIKASCGPSGDTRHNHGAPVFWRSAARGGLLYVWPENDVLRAFTWGDSVAPASCDSTPDWARGAATAPARLHPGMSGGMLTISSNQDRDGIVWAATPINNDANQQVVPGVLRAYDATDLRNQLWSSCPAPDCSTDGPNAPGNIAKMTPPTVANGRVYLATFSRKVVAYGLNPPPAPAPGRNLVVNGGFEQGMTGWSVASGRAAADQQYPFAGNQAAHLFWDYTATARVEQTVVAPATGTYRVSALCLTSYLPGAYAQPMLAPATLGVDVNGATRAMSPAVNYAGYLPCTGEVNARQGDRITIWYTAQPVGYGYDSRWSPVTWSFLDEVSLTLR